MSCDWDSGVSGDNFWVGIFLRPAIILHPTSPRDSNGDSDTIMEEDRAATNVGPDVPDVDETMASEPAVVAKQPRKRFVGRKTGDKAAEPSTDPNANIEDSSAIQGVRRILCCPMHRYSTLTAYSRTASSHCPRAERNPRRHSARQGHQRGHRIAATQLQLRDP
jgi:hypothetical protein